MHHPVGNGLVFPIPNDSKQKGWEVLASRPFIIHHAIWGCFLFSL